MTPNERMVAARKACECGPAEGIAICCALVLLPKLKLVIVGECEPVKLPEAFECPRHVIMGW